MTHQASLSPYDSRKIVIAGGSGFLGRGLAWFLADHGYQITILSRGSKIDKDWPAHTDWRIWDGRTAGDWIDCLNESSAVINVVGRSVDCRKTPKNKKIILESRVHSCQALGQAMRAVSKPPPLWLQSATAHIVGDPIPEDTICDEDTPPGEGMAPEVGQAWEQALAENILPTQRSVILRIGFVLGRNGGALRRLGLATRLGLGGTVGSGKQWMSWIHQHDLNRLFLTMMTDESYNGVYMVTAPEPVTNRVFMVVMRSAYRRPWSPPAPAFGVRLACRFILNTDPELALLGRRCVPRRLIDQHDFAFDFPKIDGAMTNLAAKTTRRR
jgi:uncharacterized protein